MFGYIRACRPELKLREMEQYKAVYCGLCHRLGKHFGPLARFTLSYDFTFLAMLDMSQRESPPQIESRRCAFNPFRKIPACPDDPALDYSCRVAAVSIYHKLLDDRRDPGFFKKLGACFALLLVRPAYRRAAEAEPEMAAEFAKAMERQPKVENDPASGLDAACEPSAAALADVMARVGRDEPSRRILARMGYLLGRYVYMADALDDLDDDIASGGFNPFAVSGREEAVASLYMTIGELGAAYDLLDKRYFGSLMDNIVYLGLRATVEQIRLPREQRSVKTV